ncbi:hypothetical protein [Eleftheria terrae]|uniref:hypothetical protein n=1 Tax=Eleftheria terrae TaxID=1597781 RepID=UPI00263A911C|nr:hypothetical protein [Eleftheria terrae]WKB55645.1 hypothetical protein N7L95_26605 [Eleftheria terrae]
MKKNPQTEPKAPGGEDPMLARPAYKKHLQRCLRQLKAHGPLNFGLVLGERPEDHRFTLHRSRNGKLLAEELRERTGLTHRTWGQASADPAQAGVLVLDLEGRVPPRARAKTQQMLKEFRPLPFAKVLLK